METYKLLIDFDFDEMEYSDLVPLLDSNSNSLFEDIEEFNNGKD